MKLAISSAALFVLMSANAALGQEPDELAELGGTEVPVVVRSGSAVVLLSEGPLLPSSGGYRTGVSYRWFVVQDSTTGVIFRKRGGFKSEGSGARFDGDIDVRTIREIMAIEFGVATFNIWNEFTGAWFVTEIRSSKDGDDFNLNPRKYPCRADEDSPTGLVCYSMSKHYTSVLWVSRVRYADGTVVLKDVQPVLDAVQTFSGEVEREQLQPEEPLIPQVPEDIVQT